MSPWTILIIGFFGSLIAGGIYFRITDVRLEERKDAPDKGASGTADTKKTEHAEEASVSDRADADAVDKKEKAVNVAPAGAETAEKKPVKVPGIFASVIILAIVNMFSEFFLETYYDLEAVMILRTIFLISVLFPCAWADLKEHIIPDKVLIAALIVRGLMICIEIAAKWDTPTYILISCGGAAGALMLAALLCRLIVPRSVGGGDIKLLGVVGAYLGMSGSMGAMFPTLVILFVYSVVMLLTKKADRHTELAFAPFVLIGTVAGVIIHGI